ncbi:hypothetical protein BH09MYX1_BH09MYX1_33170 [soil metagenome]
MRQSTLATLASGLAVVGLSAMLAGCSNGPQTLPDDPLGNTTDPNNPGNGGTPTAGPDGGVIEPTAGELGELDARKTNYGEALRTASLKLVGELPSIDDVKAMDVADPKVAYEAKIDALLADPRFAARQIQYWRDTFKTGAPGMNGNGKPDYDTAAVFATEIVVKDRPYTDMFTASSGTCPTYAGGTFTDGNCPGNGPTAGVLTNPGLQSQYFANMAFRRVRFVQETFVCSKLPTEFTNTPKQVGSGVYTSPWDFNSITGNGNTPTPRIDFQDTSSVICANCHTTMNHQAPLFGNYDAMGAYQNTIQVKTPSSGNPTTALADWLPQGQQTFAWRNGKPVTDLPSYGAAVAADPDVARCIVTREWNYAMSRGDVVNDLATVPPVVSDPLLKDFTSNGMKVKRLIRNIFTSDDFTKF